MSRWWRRGGRESLTHDTPGDGPLLAAYKSASLAGGRDLSDVDGNLGTADADSQPVDDTANDQHANVLRGTDDDRPNAPDDTANLDGRLSAQDIGEVARH